MCLELRRPFKCTNIEFVWVFVRRPGFRTLSALRPSTLLTWLCVLFAQQLAFSRTKRIGGVHDFLQILLLGKSWKDEAAERQQSDGKHCALHGTPSIERNDLALSAVLEPQPFSLPDVARSVAAKKLTLN